MFKKITTIVAAIFLVSFLGFAITLPIGIKTVFGDMTELINTTSITPKRVDINANVDTLDINIENYFYYSNYVLVKQSPDETAYIELFDADTYASSFDTISVSYPEQNIAKISMEPVYGKFQLNKDIIEKTIVKKVQNYPDAILYIPTTVNIQTRYPHFFDNVSFKNKQELIEQAEEREKAEMEQERIEQMAEELLEQRAEEEEIIRQKAEELLIEREQRYIEEQQRLEEERDREEQYNREIDYNDDEVDF